MNGTTIESRPAPTPDGPSQPSVLVVDDDESIADLYSEMLETDYEVTTAYGGEDALKLIDDRHDVVLLDRRMPGKDGSNVLAELRARGYECRVAMVTAVEPDLEIIEMPFDDYLVKPASKGEIRAIVERLYLLGQYQERHFDLSSRRVKRNVLETELSEQELSQSEEFVELQARIEELEAEMQYIETELNEEFSLTPYPA